MGSLIEARLKKIRNLVHEELCQRNQLLRDAFPFSERVLTRHGNPCGFLFCLHGPRNVRFTAVYDIEESTIYYYDSKGRRSGLRPIELSNAA